MRFGDADEEIVVLSRRHRRPDRQPSYASGTLLTDEVNNSPANATIITDGGGGKSLVTDD